MNYFDLLEKDDAGGLSTYLKTHDKNEEINGQAIIYWAVHQNKIDFVNLLIENGADINKKDSLNRTPLQIACYFGFTEIVKLLVKSHAIVDETCFLRAMNSWDGRRQNEILKILKNAV